MPCSLWERAVVAVVARQAHACFLLQCKNLLAIGTYVRSRSCWWPVLAGHSTYASEPGWEADLVCDSHCCCQWQLNKCPWFSHSGALLKSVMAQDRVLQSVPFSQSLLIVQNWIFSLWRDNWRNQKSFPLDCLMVLWLGNCLEMSGRFQFLSSDQLVWVGLSDLLDTFLSCCTCPRNVWGMCSFLFVKSPTRKPTLKKPTKSGTTSEVGGRNTRLENSYINPGFQATEQHQDFAVFACGCLWKLNMITRLGSEWIYVASYLKARLQSFRMDFSPVFRHLQNK